MKPGTKTSEFWIVAALALFAILSQTGILPESEAQNAETLLQDTAQIVAQWAAIAAAVWKYIDSRTKVKTGQQ